MGNSNQLYRLDLNTLVWELLDNADMKHPSPRDKFMYWVHEEKYVTVAYICNVSLRACTCFFQQRCFQHINS